jgi:hypothetical protein
MEEQEMMHAMHAGERVWADKPHMLEQSLCRMYAREVKAVHATKESTVGVQLYRL